MHVINKQAMAVITAIIFVLFSPGDLRAAELSQSTFTPWDVEAATREAGVQEKKPYTLMVYMNGSDLESEGGAATDDLMEMLSSGLDAQNANLLVLTGGARRWQNNVVPANDCVLWEIADGWMYKITGIGQLNMGDPGTLSGFIQFGRTSYPADRYGLILWDHGGGSIAGYGQDERFINGNLTLPDMRRAFAEAELANEKLAFLGFDSCLMSTVEMAVLAADYAQYLIASEDLEPGDGWDYSFLSILNQNPEADGKTVGVAAVDSFMSYYGADSEEILTLSVTDLSQVDAVMTAMGRLTAPCSQSLLRNRATSFRTLAGKRNRTKTFGEGSPRDNECDMVDIGDMAEKLSDLYPDESAQVIQALDACMVYNRHNSDADLRGLSAYYIYGGKSVGRPALNTYASLGMDTDYTVYLHRFFDALTQTSRSRSRSGTALAAESDDIVRVESALWTPVGGTNRYRLTGLNTQADLDAKTALWPVLNGRPVCLYPTSQTAKNKWYAIPARVNDRDCDIMVVFSEQHPHGWVEGVRNNDGLIIQKGYDPIEPGDRIALYYTEHSFDFSDGHTDKETDESACRWVRGTTFKATDTLKLTWEQAEDDAYIGKRQTDLRGQVTFTRPKPVHMGAISSPSAFVFLPFAYGFATIPQF